MSKQTANSLFIDFSLRRFYQQILGGIVSFEGLGNRIINRIKIARAFRQTDVVRQLSSILINFPVREYQLIGEYYEVWCDYRESKCRTEVLEKIIEQSKTYKTKALFSLAAFEGRKGRIETSFHLYEESLKTAPTVSEQIEVLRSIAVLKAGEGFHTSSLKDLESILPFIHHSEPLAYYDFLNSYAIELGEAGRIEEAQNVSRLTLASPYAFAYPEWRETEQDLALRGYKSRSSVRVKTIPGNLLYLPEREVSDTPVIQDEDARLFDLEEWKEKKMVKEPNGDDETNPDKMTEQDMVMKLIQMLTTGGGDEKKIRELLKFALKTFYGK
ncbi:MAG: hypothetical protein ACLGJB_11430 [Blastocatellia bacterium]